MGWPIWSTTSCCPTKPAWPNRIAASSSWRLAGSAPTPGQALFIDDTPGHVAAAQALGIAGHVHTGPLTTAAAIEAFITAA